MLGYEGDGLSFISAVDNLSNRYYKKKDLAILLTNFYYKNKFLNRK